MHCYSLKKIIIPDNVTKINAYAFSNCISLTQVIIPDSVTEIDEFAFENCFSLSIIDGGRNISKIGMKTFMSCIKLTNINILLNSLTEIGNGAFNSCQNLNNIDLTKINNIHGNILTECLSLNSISGSKSDNSGHMFFRKCDDKSAQIRVMNTIDDSPVWINNFIDDIFNGFEEEDFFSDGGSSYTKNHAKFGINNNRLLAEVDPNYTSEWIFQVSDRNELINMNFNLNMHDHNCYHILRDHTNYPLQSKSHLGSGVGLNTPFSRYNKGEHNINNQLKNITISSESQYPWLYRALVKARVGDGLNTDNHNNILVPKTKQHGLHGIVPGLNLTNIPFIKNLQIENINNLNISTKSNTILPLKNSKQLIKKTADIEFNTPLKYLKNITISDNINIIPDRYFSNFFNLEKIFIPNSVHHLGNYVFENCHNIKEIVIGDGVTDIGFGILHGCHNLEKIVIGNSVTSLGTLYSIIQYPWFPEGMVDYSSFQNAGSQGVLSHNQGTLPIGIHYQNNYFTDKLKYLNKWSNGNLVSHKFVDNSLEDKLYFLSVEPEYFGFQSLGIYDSALHTNNYVINHIKSKKDIIGTLAYSTPAVDYPTSIIGKNTKWTSNNSMFHHSRNLRSVTLGNSITEIYGLCFSCCTNLTEVIIGNSVTEIGPRAFENCLNLKYINIPSSVQKIETRAFSNCISLTKINFENGIKFISLETFYECKNLREMYIPVSVTEIIGPIVNINNFNLIKISLYNGLLSDVRSKDICLNGFTFNEGVLQNNTLILQDNGADNEIYKLQAVGLADSILVNNGILNNITKENLNHFTLVQENSLTNRVWNWLGHYDARSIAEERSPAAFPYTEGFLYYSKEALALENDWEDQTADQGYLYKANNDVLYKHSLHDESNLLTLNSINSLTIPDNISKIMYQTFFRGSIDELIIPDIDLDFLGQGFYECRFKKIIIKNLGRINNKFRTMMPQGVNFSNSIGLDTFFDKWYDFSLRTFLPYKNWPKNFRNLTQVTDNNGPWLTRNAKIPAMSFLDSIIKWPILEIDPDTVEIHVGGDLSNIMDKLGLHLFTYNRTFSPPPINLTILKSATNLQRFKTNDCIKKITFESRGESDTLLETLPSNMFLDCEGLTEIILPEGLKTIPTYSLKSEYLTKVVIPDSVTFIGNHVFYNCVNLTDIVISPSSQIVVSATAFTGCPLIKTYELLDWVNDTNLAALSKYNSTYASGLSCKFIENIIIPSSISVMPTSAIATGGLINLKKIIIKSDENDNGLKIIPNLCCRQINSLTELIIGDSVTEIGDDAFEECRNLQKIFFGKNIKKIGKEAFHKCYSLTEIILPHGITEIGLNAFEECRNLKKVFIPNTLEIMANYAFRQIKFGALINVETSDSIANRPQWMLQPTDDNDSPDMYRNKTNGIWSNIESYTSSYGSVYINLFSSAYPSLPIPITETIDEPLPESVVNEPIVDEKMHTFEHIKHLYIDEGKDSAPDYKFYINEEGTKELSPPRTLYLDTKYIFHRLNNCKSHPFYISTKGYNLQSKSSEIFIDGNGYCRFGIRVFDELELIFKNLKITDKLYYFCTSHSTMMGEFNLVKTTPKSTETYNLVRIPAKNWVKLSFLNNYKTNYISEIITSQQDMENIYIKSDEQYALYTSNSWSEDIIIKNNKTYKIYNPTNQNINLSIPLDIYR